MNLEAAAWSCSSLEQDPKYCKMLVVLRLQQGTEAASQDSAAGSIVQREQFGLVYHNGELSDAAGSKQGGADNPGCPQGPSSKIPRAPLSPPCLVMVPSGESFSGSTAQGSPGQATWLDLAVLGND